MAIAALLHVASGGNFKADPAHEATEWVGLSVCYRVIDVIDFLVCVVRVRLHANSGHPCWRLRMATHAVRDRGRTLCTWKIFVFALIRRRKKKKQLTFPLALPQPRKPREEVHVRGKRAYAIKASPFAHLLPTLGTEQLMLIPSLFVLRVASTCSLACTHLWFIRCGSYGKPR